jgi:hypothetical protein
LELEAAWSMVNVALPESLPSAPAAAMVCGPLAPEHCGDGWVMLAVQRPLPAM